MLFALNTQVENALRIREHDYQNPRKSRQYMASLLEERIQRAVIDGYEARLAHYTSIDPDMADEQQLGSPAPESRIVDLETRLGRPLPPSYRAFLGMYNGWRMGVNAATDLLSVEEMLDGPRAEEVREWRQHA